MAFVMVCKSGLPVNVRSLLKLGEWKQTLIAYQAFYDERGCRQRILPYAYLSRYVSYTNSNNSPK